MMGQTLAHANQPMRSAFSQFLFNDLQGCLQIGLTIGQIMAGGIARQGTAAAATVIMMLVPIVVFVTVQSNVVETVATSGMKD